MYKKLKEYLDLYGNTTCSKNDEKTIKKFQELGCEIRQVRKYNGHTGSVCHDVVTIWRAK